MVVSYAPVGPLSQAIVRTWGTSSRMLGQSEYAGESGGTLSRTGLDACFSSLDRTWTLKVPKKEGLKKGPESHVFFFTYLCGPGRKAEGPDALRY